MRSPFFVGSDPRPSRAPNVRWPWPWPERMTPAQTHDHCYCRREEVGGIPHQVCCMCGQRHAISKWGQTP